jgi:hypothetical protein
MRKFGDVRLTGDGKVRVRGPFTVDQGVHVARLTFVLAQQDAAAEGEGMFDNQHWSGEADAGDLAAGAATVAVGIAVLLDGGAVQSFTWCEQVRVVT